MQLVLQLIFVSIDCASALSVQFQFKNKLNYFAKFELFFLL